MISLSCTIGIIPINAKENENNITKNKCQVVQTVDEGTKENEEFIEYIESKENIDINDDNIDVIYYADGDVHIVEKLENGDAIIYSPINDADQISDHKNEKGWIEDAVWFAITALSKVYNAITHVYDFVCTVLENTGNEDVCKYINQAIIDSIANGATVNYRIEKYIYKDPACPYPPYSAQCSQSPYAYYKTYLKRIY